MGNGVLDTVAFTTVRKTLNNLENLMLHPCNTIPHALDYFCQETPPREGAYQMEARSLRHISEANRLAARAEALADARLGWSETSAAHLFLACTLHEAAEYVDGSATELYEIYLRAWSVQPRAQAKQLIRTGAVK